MWFASSSRTRIAALAGAALMIVIGAVLSCRSQPAASQTPNVEMREATTEDRVEAGTAPETAAPEHPSEAAPPADTPPQELTSPAPEPSAAPSRPASKPVVRVASRASSDALPPLPPLRYGPESVSPEPSGPPPGVLWLAGVIQGNPTLALLRRGEDRYLVKEGDALDGGYRVAKIASSSVILQRGNRKQTLRLGQY
jgi:hypothetical protein